LAVYLLQRYQLRFSWQLTREEEGTT
jgi:hypothetical protein